MTMNEPNCDHDSCLFRHSPFVICHLVLVLLVMFASSGFAQQGRIHYFHHWDHPPGTIGKGQLLRGGPLNGYYQAVEIRAPEGVEISLARDGRFQRPEPAPLKIGMLIGQVYRFQVTNIHRHAGMEVYPSIEVVNRLYPPQGQKTRFPIPIELTQEELQMALSGQYVTRVIYLEDPTKAVPVQESNEQRYFDVGVADDPLKTADELGRPMAILRMGSRVPDYNQVARRFSFGMPPFVKYTNTASQEQPHSTARPSAIEHIENVPRIPLPTGVFMSSQSQ